MRLTADQIEKGRSPAGGWTRKQLAAWGVPWPPPKGWRNKLMRGTEPSLTTKRTTRLKLKTSASDFPNLPMARFYFCRPYSSTLDRA